MRMRMPVQHAALLPKAKDSKPTATEPNCRQQRTSVNCACPTTRGVGLMAGVDARDKYHGAGVLANVVLPYALMLPHAGASRQNQNLTQSVLETNGDHSIEQSCSFAVLRSL